MSLIRDKEELITNSYEAFREKLSKIDKDILNAILDFVKENSQSKPTKATLSKINKALSKIITPDKFKDPVSKFLKNFDQVAEISKKILEADGDLDLKNFDLGAEKEMAIEDITKGLLNKDMLDANLHKPLRKIMYRYATTNINLKVAEDEIRNYVIGENESGLTQRYVKTLAIESLSRFDGVINQKVATEYKLDGFRIVGSLIKSSQEQCIQMVNMTGELGKFAVNGKYAMDDVEEIIAILRKKHKGVNKELTVGNYFELRNHWGCRHQFIPTRLLKRDLEELARRKGERVEPEVKVEPTIFKYTDAQIASAKAAYNDFLQYEKPKYTAVISRDLAESRADFHNKLVDKIKAGDRALEAEWKRFFLNEERKKVAIAQKQQNKLKANKDASSDVLSQVKAAGRKLGDYYEFVKNNRKYAKEFYSKKFTQYSVNAFLNS